MVSRVAMDTLKKAGSIKDKLVKIQSGGIDTYVMDETWSLKQELQGLYKEVLLLDLEYALDQKVEQDLWNLCFKNFIVALQKLSKNNKFQVRLSWCLDSASGFYIALLQDICSSFNMDLPFMRTNCLYGNKRYYDENILNSRPNSNSRYYICEHCLVHLGDIARYRNQMVQAESFYRHAMALGSNSGHPYNQLALLQASHADHLGTVFYYVRSIAVTHKFPAALTNLEKTLLKFTVVQDLKEGVKMSTSDYEQAFLKFNALLYLSQDVSGASGILHSLNSALTPIIGTLEISSWKLIQMACIAMFTFTHAEEKKSDVQGLLMEFLTGFLNALLVPIYTVSAETIMDYFGLPTIKVLMSWMKCHPELTVALNRQHLWRGICKLLNLLRSSHAICPVHCINAALPEDYDLRGFLPLELAHCSLNFGGEDLCDDTVKKLRGFRLIKLGEWLATESDLKPIQLSEEGHFEAVNFTTPSNEKARPTVRVGQIGSMQDAWKGSSRNVALQSILRKNMVSDTESDVENGQGDWLVPKTGLDWWPQGSPREDLGPCWGSINQDVNSIGSQEGTYSLFSGGTDLQNNISTTFPRPPVLNQSLWSGPGPSPLERLLEQQKQQRTQYDT